MILFVKMNNIEILFIDLEEDLRYIILDFLYLDFY